GRERFSREREACRKLRGRKDQRSRRRRQEGREEGHRARLRLITGAFPWRCLDVRQLVFTLCSMASRLLNVRLSPDDEQLVKRLRARGISISELMRRALRAEATKAAHEPVDAHAL